MDQASEMLRRIDRYTRPAAYIAKVISDLKPLTAQNTPFTQFELALKDLGDTLGFDAERPDNGRRPRKGPDVLWLAPNLEAFVIEAKNGKGEAGHFHRDDHGQLLQACEWFKTQYPAWSFDRVVVLSKAIATQSVDLGITVALDADAVAKLVDDLISALRCISQLPKTPRRQPDALAVIERFRLTPAHIRERFKPFERVVDRRGESMILNL